MISDTNQSRVVQTSILSIAIGKWEQEGGIWRVCYDFYSRVCCGYALDR
jgi:hypothetical protein